MGECREREVERGRTDGEVIERETKEIERVE
jgi:hypothetical protein